MMFIDAAAHVFNANVQMEHHVAVAAFDIGRVFEEIDSSLDRGSSVRNAAGLSRTEKVGAAMKRVIASARLAGFAHGAKVTKKSMPALYGRRISKYAGRRADRVHAQMARTTRKRLKSTPDSAHVLSRDRAISAARYESGKAYFKGVKDAFSGTGYRKAWQAGDSCDICLENADQGLIDVDDVFDSGHYAPQAHLNCTCYLTVRKGKV